MLTDLSFFFLIYFFCLAVFVFLHWIALRSYDSKSVLIYIAGIIIVSVLIASALSWIWISKFFSSFEVYVLANTGAALAAVFTCGLYAFLGPVTADRSIAVQLVIFLYNSKQGESKEEISRRFNTRAVLDKRYEECLRAKIIKEQDGQITLTPKGQRIAQIYLLMLQGLGLLKRSQYKNYFSSKDS